MFTTTLTLLLTILRITSLLIFLNSITPNGLPLHELKLKINCSVILLCNLDPNNGLCNEIRLMVRALQDNAIDAEIVGGQHAQKKGFHTKAPIVSLG
jgi:ATP-dependent DNA helicase PIF1